MEMYGFKQLRRILSPPQTEHRTRQKYFTTRFRLHGKLHRQKDRPSNQVTLQNLAQQIATDWVQWKTGIGQGTDVCLDDIILWQPDGCTAITGGCPDQIALLA